MKEKGGKKQVVSPFFLPTLFALCVTLFLLPANFFLKFEIPTAIVNGAIVDYLLPRIFLSDIFLILYCIFCSIIVWKDILKSFNLIRLTILLFIAHLIVTDATVPSIWFAGKSVIMLFFALMLVHWRNYLTSLPNRLSTMAYQAVVCSLLAGIFFQLAVAGYQIVTGRSVAGYYLLGEPAFDSPLLLAKSEKPGEIRILPYGTTAHPNVLAGYVVFASLLSWQLLNQHAIMQKRFKNISALFLSLVASATSYLAESATAIYATLFAVGSQIVTMTSNVVQKLKMWQFAVFALFLFVGTPMFMNAFAKHSTNTPPSIERRTQLHAIAGKMFMDHPITGVGLNRFTEHMSRYGTVDATTRFLQPVHQVPLLLLAETGVLGFIFLILFFNSVQKYYSLNFSFFFPFLFPFIVILTLDHYLFTLQAGQLLCAVILGFSMKKKSEK